MSEIAFWSFEDGPAAESGDTADAAAGGRLVLEEGAQWPGADTQAPSALATGTLKLEFRLPTAPDNESAPILSMGAHADARLDLSVNTAGQVVLAHDDGAQTLEVETPQGFCAPGDDLRLTYAWGAEDDAAGLTVENLTSDAHHHAPAPPGLTLNLNDDPEAALTVSEAANVRLDYVALYDHHEPAGLPVANADETPPAGEEPDAVESGNSADKGDLLRLTFEGGDAEKAHLFGHYQVDPDSGAISGVTLDFADTRPEFAGGDLTPGVSQSATAITPQADIGAFLVVGGGETNDLDALSQGELAFLNEHGEPVTVLDTAPQLWHLGADGTATELTGDVWHSAGHGETAALNSDGESHLRGVSENVDGTWSFDFHDSGSHEAQADAAQLLFTVDLGRSGARFLNPDHTSRGTLGADDANDAAALFSDEEDEAPLSAEEYAGAPRFATVSADAAASPAAGAPVAAAFEAADANDADDAENNDKSGDDDKKIVPCFTAGTLIETDEGRIPVEELFVGDRVLTRDRGFRRLVWVGQKEVSVELMRARPEFAPVRIARGSLDDALPERDMLVSPQHRMLVSGWRAELMFGVNEVLVPAKHLIGRPGIERAHDTPVTYVHVMCDRHEIVRADGCWSESFQPGDLSLAGLDGEQRAELLALFPELGGQVGRRDYTAARMTLKAYEVRAMFNL